MVLGHWPTPNVEDPKLLPTAWFHLVTQVIVWSVLPGSAVLLALVYKNRGLLRRPGKYWICLAVFVVSLALYLLVGRLDPRTMEWWAD